MRILSKRYPTVLVLLIAGSTLLFSGCFHQQVVTGKASSSDVIENAWANSFVFGLVPPPVVDTMQECPDGVARVETKITFLNGLVSGLTLNLYTPMYVKVTCAAGGSARVDLQMPSPTAVQVPAQASAEEKRDRVQDAIERSRVAGTPVLVQFDAGR